MLVVRKIARGLHHYHKFGTAIDDRRVQAMVLRFEIPEEFRGELTTVDLGAGFCQYSYTNLRGANPQIASFWVIRFYDRCTFYAAISAHADGWPE